MTPRQMLRIIGDELRGRPFFIAVLIALLGLTIWAIIPSPRREIKEVTKSAERSMEARNIDRVGALLARSFYSEEVGGGREAAIAVLKDAFDYVISLEIHIKRIRTDVSDGRATSDVDFRVMGTLRGADVYSQIPFSGVKAQGELANPLERCRLTWIKESDGYWRVSGVQLLGAVK